MSDRIFNVLFICTGNSARSILAECLLNHMARGRMRAWSAGSHPAGAVNPYTIKTLAKWEIEHNDVRSKSWDEFTGPDAPHFDFVITVCDRAAGEVCPVWPGQPILAHWGAPDPAAATGSEEHIMHEFTVVTNLIRYRIELFLSLPMAKLGRLALETATRDIGNKSS